MHARDRTVGRRRGVDDSGRGTISASIVLGQSGPGTGGAALRCQSTAIGRRPEALLPRESIGLHSMPSRASVAIPQRLAEMSPYEAIDPPYRRRMSWLERLDVRGVRSRCPSANGLRGVQPQDTADVALGKHHVGNELCGQFVRPDFAHLASDDPSARHVHAQTAASCLQLQELEPSPS